MKKISSQITVALVCCILGFILTYQFKQVNEVNKSEKSSQVKGNTADINMQIQLLTNQKNDMQSQIDKLESKIKNYESTAANSNTTNSQLFKDLQDSKVINGTVDVKGPGVVIEIKPKARLFENKPVSPSMTPKELVVLINDLLASNAEAISVNDIRITSRTGIVLSGKFIKINNTKFPMDKKFTVKVIGDKKTINYSLDYLQILEEFKDYECTYLPSSDIFIPKYEGEFKFDFAKPVEENKK